MRAVLAALLLTTCSCSRASDDPFAGSAEPAAKTGSATTPTVTITPPANAIAGADTTARVSVTPPAGFHVNHEFPIKLDLAAGAGVTLAKTSIARGDADVELDDAHLAMIVHMTPTAGTHEVTGNLSIGFCKSDQCVTKKLPVAVTVAAR